MCLGAYTRRAFTASARSEMHNYYQSGCSSVRPFDQYGSTYDNFTASAITWPFALSVIRIP